jgi:hypothetical protein
VGVQVRAQVAHVRCLPPRVALHHQSLDRP